MTRLLFLIRSLERGGAERQLVELVKGIDKTHFRITVATFYDGGALHTEIEGLEGVTILSLHKRCRWDTLPFIWRLWKVTRAAKPDLMHGYMSIANEMCLLIGPLARAKVIWGMRASNVDLSHYDWMSGWVFKIGAWLSRFPDLIIVNSYAGQAHYRAHGYAGTRMLVIPNGIDTGRFKPDREAGRRVRMEWGVSPSETLIGLVARLDPMKDHQTFLRAAGLASQVWPGLRFVCVGDGPAPYQRELMALGAELGLGKKLIWSGARDDLLAVYNALDIATSSSTYGEGFSNVIGEAMACGVPCAVTDVGDATRIVGEAGLVVPPSNPEVLALAWEHLLRQSGSERQALAARAQARIQQEFSVSAMIAQTEAALQELAVGA